MANFTIASTSRVFNKEVGEWRDGDTLFMRCTVWQQSAENLADSLTKGTRVIVSGRLRQRSFETREGEKRTAVELVVEEVGVSLRYARVQITKTTRTATSMSSTHPNGQSHQRQRAVVVWGCKEHQTPAGEECQGCVDQGELFTRADAANSARKRSYFDRRRPQ